jgi:hypothetical protein
VGRLGSSVGANSALPSPGSPQQHVERVFIQTHVYFWTVENFRFPDNGINSRQAQTPDV